MNLARVQLWSLGTKGVTLALGIVQSLLVVNILGPERYGLVGLVLSLGGLVGVTQHLGVLDGTIREMAIARDKLESGKIYLAAHAVRQLVTVPLSIILLLLAGVVAEKIYGRPEIAVYLQIFAGILVLQGLQDVMGGALTGLKLWRGLYVSQMVTSALNVAVFGWLTWQFGVSGFFWAIVITTTLMVLILGWLLARQLRGVLRWPRWPDFKTYGWRLVRISGVMYVARILFIIWQRLPILLLGGVLAGDQLGFLAISQTFGARLTIIAMALAEVNISWLSTLYQRSKQEFKVEVQKNWQRVQLVMLLITLSLLYLTPEILIYLMPEFVGAYQIILVMTVAFYFYALLDIATSSVFVPSGRARWRAVTYGLMTGLALIGMVWLLVTNPTAVVAAVIVLGAVLVAYGLMVVLARQMVGVKLITLANAAMMMLALLSIGMLWQEPAWLLRLLMWGGLTLLALILSWPSLSIGRRNEGRRIVCFAGAAFDNNQWTNRQQIMSRLAHVYPILYVEPRVWIFRYVLKHWRHPKQVGAYVWRLIGWEARGERLWIISQWNLMPGSRESKVISRFNHWLNVPRIMFVAKWLGFNSSDLVVWLYDTEAAEYLPRFGGAKVVYDCVDDHAAQAGADRNPSRVYEEENEILARADLVTVTSLQLFQAKRGLNNNVHLVLNAGDVELYALTFQKSRGVSKPVIGSVGTLDAYKYDFDLIYALAKRRPNWQFEFIGDPLVDQKSGELEKLGKLANVSLRGAVERMKVPALVSKFDICIIPYRDNTYNRSSFPLKFWEFMATGKPIVVSGLPELKKYRDVVGYAVGVESFERLLETWLKEPGRGRLKRKELASRHSYESRVRILLELVDKL